MLLQVFAGVPGLVDVRGAADWGITGFLNGGGLLLLPVAHASLDPVADSLVDFVPVIECLQ